jgi:hypothetical protein
MYLSSRPPAPRYVKKALAQLFATRGTIALAIVAVVPFIPIWLNTIRCRTVIDHAVGLQLQGSRCGRRSFT